MSGAATWVGMDNRSFAVQRRIRVSWENHVTDLSGNTYVHKILQGKLCERNMLKTRHSERVQRLQENIFQQKRVAQWH